MGEAPSFSIIIVGLTVLCAFLVSSVNIYLHLRYYSNPNLQLYIIRILLLIPLYCIMTFLSLTNPGQAPYFDIIRDVYEAFAIYSFFNLMLTYCGGQAACVHQIMVRPCTIRHPWPLCNLPPISLGTKFLRLCKQGVLQFVIIKPVMAATSLLMLGLHKYDEPGYAWYVTVVYNVCYTIALYVLYLFYAATNHLLSGHQPLLKFASIKTIVLFTWWQRLVIENMPVEISDTDKQWWSNFVLCWELLPFTILQVCAFGFSEFKSDLDDSSVLDNMGSVLNVRDVKRDIFHSFKPSYQEYVLTSSGEQTGKKKVFRAKTFLVGNLGNMESENPEMVEMEMDLEQQDLESYDADHHNTTLQMERYSLDEGEGSFDEENMSGHGGFFAGGGLVAYDDETNSNEKKTKVKTEVSQGHGDQQRAIDSSSSSSKSNNKGTARMVDLEFE